MRKFNYRGRLITAATKRQAIRKILAYGENVQDEVLNILNGVSLDDITGSRGCWDEYRGGKMGNIGPEYRSEGPGKPFQPMGVGYQRTATTTVKELEDCGVDMSGLRNATAGIEDDSVVSAIIRAGFVDDEVSVKVWFVCEDCGSDTFSRTYTADASGLAKLEGDINTLDAGPSLGMA